MDLFLGYYYAFYVAACCCQIHGTPLLDVIDFTF